MRLCALVIAVILFVPTAFSCPLNYDEISAIDKESLYALRILEESGKEAVFWHNEFVDGSSLVICERQTEFQARTLFYERSEAEMRLLAGTNGTYVISYR